MPTDCLRIGMGSYERAGGQLRKLPESRLRQMGDIEQHAFLIAPLDKLTPSVRQTAVPLLQYAVRRPIRIIPGKPKQPDSQIEGRFRIEQIALQPLRTLY
ncbi:hypothetical protein D3C71_1777690 [compost metagenome]